MNVYVKIIPCCFLAVVLATAAYGAEGPYVRGSIGVANLEDVDANDPSSNYTNKLESGLSLEVAAGYGFNDFRVEGEVSYQENDYDKVQAPSGEFINATGNYTNLSFLINCYYDFSNSSAFTPFIGAGAGFSTVDVNDLHGEGWASKVNVDDTVFTYQFSAGVGYAINESFIIDAMYRYLATEDPSFDGGVEYEFASHNFLVGLRFNF